MKRLLDWLPSTSAVVAVDQRIGEVENKMKTLLARADDVFKELEHAEIQPGKKRRAEVNQWLSVVERKRSEFQKIEKEGQIERMAKEVEDLIQQGRFPHGLVLHDHETTRLPLVIVKPVEKLFELNVEKIMGWLKNPQHHMFGVYGMGGVGKTTLLKHIHDKLLEDSSVYGRVYWVTVSQNCSMYKLQHDIAKVVGLELSTEEDLDKRAALLHHRVLIMGRIILILDDMWEFFPVEKVGIPLGDKSCKILLTTRELGVCRKMGCDKFRVEVKPLSKNEAWDLFVDALHNYQKLDVEVKNVAKLVAEECGCLPLAINTIAGSMRGVFDVVEWQNALDELRNPHREQSDMENEVFPKLKFSYDRLDNELLKSCFLSCVLYPEDHKIKRTKLIDVWIHEGLLDEIESREEQVRKGHVVLNRLENSCLLESTTDRDKEQCVKMHDLIRDMAINITKKCPRFMAKAGLRLKEAPDEEQWKEDLVKASLTANYIEKIPGDTSPICPRLSLLMLNWNPLNEIAESFFVHMRALTVLDLTHTDIKRLPDSVSDLGNLRALILEECECLEYVPSLVKLTKLRVLRLPLVWKMKKAPEGMDELRRLEEVSGNLLWDFSQVAYFNSFITSAVKLGRNGFAIHGEMSSCDCPYYGNYYEDFQQKNGVLICSGEIKEEIPSPLFPADTIRHLYIEKVEIKGRRRSLGQVLPTLVAATQLKELEIFECRGLEWIWSAEELEILDTLEYLTLEELSDLRQIVSEVGGGNRGIAHQLTSPYSSPPPRPPRTASYFANLRWLTIYKCPKMKVVFEHNLLHNLLRPHPLPNLLSVCVEECEEVEEIFESRNSSGGAACILALPNLRWIQLQGLPKLGSIYRGGLLLCTSLESLNIRECPELEILRPSKMSGI